MAALAIFATASPFLSPAHAGVPQVLRNREEKIRHVARAAAPAVVALVPDTGSEQGRRSFGTGSGVIVSSDGLILTAAHVLQALGDEFEVLFSDGSRAKAKALGRHFSRDAALAQITTKGSYAFVDQATPDSLHEGDWCLAFGHPGGYEFDRPAPLRLGRILDIDNGGFVVTDCTLSGGDSGGPLFNLDGKLIGIHSSIGWRLAENRHVPIAAFKDGWDRLMKGESWGRLARPGEARERRGPRLPDQRPNRLPREFPRPEASPNHPVLGVEVQPSDESGALVARVRPGSPARAAGLKAGDVIEKINDQGIGDDLILVEVIGKMKPGEKITISVKRDGETVRLEATLAAAKDLDENE